MCQCRQVSILVTATGIAGLAEVPGGAEEGRL